MWLRLVWCKHGMYVFTMVWCGGVWYGMVWDGIGWLAWYVVRYKPYHTWYDIASYGMVGYVMTTVRYVDMASYGLVT